MSSTFLTAHAVKSVLTRLYERKNSKTLNTLAPSIANLVYIVGLRVALESLSIQSVAGKWIEGAIYILAVIILIRLINKAALLGIEFSLSRVENSKTLRQGFLPLFKNLITVFIFSSGGIVILNHFHYDAMSLITALGVSSLAVGLAAKDTLSNMISGFILLLDRNLRPGDDIQLSDLSGKVVEIGLRSTQLLLGDGNTLIVPNTDLVNTKILNLSISPQEKLCNIQIRIPLSESFSKIRIHTFQILDDIEQVSQSQPKSIHLSKLTDGFQSIQIAFWVKHLKDVGPTTSLFNENLLDRAQKNEIELFTHSPPKIQ
jgi:small-conductance mechanosensitive channel